MNERKDASNETGFEQNLGKLGALGFALGALTFTLGLYCMPAKAGDIQRAFLAEGVVKRATVVDKRTEKRTYIDGTGTRGRRTSFDEHVLTVRVDDRTETISHLVLAADLDRLAPGDQVDVTVVKRPVECHDQGSRSVGSASVVLTSSVSRGRFELLGWSRGRGLPGASIAGLVIGGFFLVIGALFLWASRQNQKGETA